jgi:molybdenum cofactor cytidylyltransferase
MIAACVLAAGDGTRFGGPKQLAELDGRPLLEHALATARGSGVDRTVVVLGAQADRVIAGVDLQGAEPVVCARWDKGQSASLACGLAEVEDAEAAVILLGDQPLVPSAAVDRVLDARGETPAVRATYGGDPGHPVVVERTLFTALRDVTGDVGARNVLLSAGMTEVPCDDLGFGADVDTPGQLMEMRNRLVGP